VDGRLSGHPARVPRDDGKARRGLIRRLPGRAHDNRIGRRGGGLPL